MVTAAAAAALLLAAHGAAAQEPTGRWQTLANNPACQVWLTANPLLEETVTWSGPCVAGKADGEGQLDWHFRDKDGAEWTATYEGTMRVGKLNGRAIFAVSNGTRYEGEFVAGKLHGRGVYTYVNGDRYEGDFVDGNRHGRGVFTWTDGNRYEGEYRDGLPNGFGTYTNAREGSTFTGHWANGCFQQGNRQAAVNTTFESCGFR